MRKSLSVACATVLAGVASAVYADMPGIQLLSQEYSVAGYVDVLFDPAKNQPTLDPGTPRDIHDSYSQTAATSVSGGVDHYPIGIPGSAMSSASLLDVHQETATGRTKVVIGDYIYPVRTRASSSASAFITFRPMENSLEATFDFSGLDIRPGSWMTLALTDVTDGTSLLELAGMNYDIVDMYQSQAGPLLSEIFSVDPTHEYSLFMSVVGDESLRDSNAGFHGSLAAVPAPSAVALGLIGLGMVGWIKRRFE